jgi:electron transfer flavoprotein alpha subunit
VNNIFIYCEVEEGQVAEVSLELLTKGRSLANQLNCKLEAIAIGCNLGTVPDQVYQYGVDVVHIADDPRLSNYLTMPHASIVIGIFRKEVPQIGLFGATSVGRDLAPRVASAMKSGLTADCTQLEIGDHFEKKTETEFKNLLYQIRPAFGGNIIATIINPETKPQLATVREGVMKKEIVSPTFKGKVKLVSVNELLDGTEFAVEIIERHMEQRKVNIKAAPIVVAGGYGVGSKETFDLLFELAHLLGGEVGASRAAVDAGFIDHDRQVGQTGITVRPKLYIACGISGQIQHRAGMEESSMIISINSDPNAPIHHIADYAIVGDVSEVIPKMIRYYKKNSK